MLTEVLRTIHSVVGRYESLDHGDQEDVSTVFTSALEVNFSSFVVVILNTPLLVIEHYQWGCDQSAAVGTASAPQTPHSTPSTHHTYYAYTTNHYNTIHYRHAHTNTCTHTHR